MSEQSTPDPPRRRFPLGSPTTFPEPWVDLDETRAPVLAAELGAELDVGHVLQGAEFRLLAQCSGCDNVLGNTIDGRWFVTHLSWSRQDRPPWPHTTVTDSLEAMLAEFDDHVH